MHPSFSLFSFLRTYKHKKYKFDHTQNIHNYIGDVIEKREKKMQISKKQKGEKTNEIMINIVSNAYSFLSLSLSPLVSFGMNDNHKKQTERLLFFFAT
jgi:hypothetical protein